MGASEAPPARQSLAEIAKKVKLQLPPDQRKLDNEMVRKLGQGVKLGAPSPTVPPTHAPLSLEAWRQRYQEARGRVLGLQLVIQRASELLRRGASGAEEVMLQRTIRRAERELELMRHAPQHVLEQALATGAKRESFEQLPPPTPIFPSWVEGESLLLGSR
ncbi:MAG: hypothetical protein NZ869_09100 [Thermoanaerobaculum sp.]|nr:hypothetical protein [Thermoanaerobaculum sp.]MDW7966966.1 hypothetical protein [Thermoanaerobaculum sp.]